MGWLRIPRVHLHQAVLGIVDERVSRRAILACFHEPSNRHCYEPAVVARGGVHCVRVRRQRLLKPPFVSADCLSSRICKCSFL